MKQCPRCGKHKPASEYYDQPSAKDGKMGVCVACHKKHMADLRRDNPDVRARDKARSKDPKRIEKATMVAKRWRQENPDAYKAQTAVGNALRDGKMKREPCAICAETYRVHAHHKDYSKPLEVIWLCARCHHRLHAIFPEIEGLNKKSRYSA